MVLVVPMTPQDEGRERAVKVEVISGPEGPCLAVDGHRVAGPKPWGGGRVVHSFEVRASELADRLRTPTAEPDMGRTPWEAAAVEMWDKAEEAYTSHHVGDQYGLVAAGRALRDCIVRADPSGEVGEEDEVERDLRDSAQRLQMCAAHWREHGKPDGNSDYGIRLMEFTAERINAALARLRRTPEESEREARKAAVAEAYIEGSYLVIPAGVLRGEDGWHEDVRREAAIHLEDTLRALTDTSEEV